MSSPRITFAVCSLCSLLLIALLVQAKIPEDREIVCKKCTDARWRECQTDPHKNVLNTCMCVPNFDAQTVSLYCDSDNNVNPNTLAESKKRAADKCCAFSNSKDSDNWDDFRRNNSAIPCVLQNDLTIHISYFNHLNEELFIAMREVAKDLVTAWLTKGHPRSRVAVYYFGDGAEKVVTFDQSTSMAPESLHKLIDSHEFRGDRFDCIQTSMDTVAEEFGYPRKVKPVRQNFVSDPG